MIEQDTVPRISPQELKRRQDSGEPVVILDVRRHPDEASLPGALHFDPEDILQVYNFELPVPKDRTIVAYCT